MSFIRREYLQQEIDRLQEEKLSALERTKTDDKLEKSEAMLDFLVLNEKQSVLEEELSNLEME